MDHFLLSHYSQGTLIGFRQKDLHIKTGLQGYVLYISFIKPLRFWEDSGTLSLPRAFFQQISLGMWVLLIYLPCQFTLVPSCVSFSFTFTLLSYRCCLSSPGTMLLPQFSWMSWSQLWVKEALFLGNWWDHFGIKRERFRGCASHSWQLLWELARGSKREGGAGLYNQLCCTLKGFEIEIKGSGEWNSIPAVVRGK